jgi:N-acetylneuraminic acid mutarotase
MGTLTPKLRSSPVVLLLVFALCNVHFLVAQENSEDPSRRIYHSILYHDASGRVLLFGGHTQHSWIADLRDVWSLDLGSGGWNQVATYEPSPLDGEAQAPAYDAQSDRVVVLNTMGETWAYEHASGTWTNMSPHTAPSRRAGQRMAYDAQSDRLILFGGFKATSLDDPALDETWAYDFDSNRWTLMDPEVSPPARMYHVMEYDPVADRIVLWGGRRLEPLEDNSVWAYDYESNTWTEHVTSGGPEKPLAYPSMVYLEALGQMFVFGGADLDSTFVGDLTNQSWLYDLESNTWRGLNAANTPPPIYLHAAAYDRMDGQVVVFGGERERPYSNVTNGETWVYDPVSKSWRRM